MPKRNQMEQDRERERDGEGKKRRKCAQCDPELLCKHPSMWNRSTKRVQRKSNKKERKIMPKYNMMRKESHELYK